MPVTELPEDILFLILPLLGPKDFLSFVTINKAFHDTFRLDASYWRNQISSTFRLPISPLLYAEGGARWYQLYKKLRTETTAFTWGQDSDGALGLDGNFPIRLDPPPLDRDRHGNVLPVPLRRLRPHRLPPRATPHIYYPEQMHIPEEIGTIADLQCGGWSTSILTSKGDIWSVGILDAADEARYGQPAQVLTKLQWGITPGEDHSSTTQIIPIRQFSSGRRHLLGLDDRGNIWCWDQIYQQAKQIEFFSPELIGSAKPTKVVAGWQTSTAFVPGKGIVYWRPRWRDDNPHQTIHEKIVPNTGFAASRHRSVEDETISEAERIGGVIGYVVLENYIVYITSASRVYAYKHDDDSHQLFEATSLIDPGAELLDIQGSFRNFAIFTSTGEVITCHQTYLDNWIAALSRIRDLEGIQGVPTTMLETANRPLVEPPPLIPALQQASVISLAFGDYHFHALHANGTVSSYGSEPGSCGAFGLGSNDQMIARLRGLIPPAERLFRNRDTKLSEQGWRSPRAIWFDEERHAWIAKLAGQGRKGGWDEGVENRGLDETDWAGISEWIEQESRTWYGTPGGSRQENREAAKYKNYSAQQTELPPYFAVAISAAGWHSGALVLVDPDPDHDHQRRPEPQNPLAQSPPPPQQQQQQQRLTAAGEQGSSAATDREFPNLPSRLRLPTGKIIQGSTTLSHHSNTNAGGIDNAATASSPAAELEETPWKFGMPERLYTSADGPPGGRTERG